MKTRIISATFALLASLCVMPLGASAQEVAKEVRVMTWGGLWLDIFRPVAAKFEKETGIKVEFVVQSGAGDGLNKITAQKANPQVDVWTSIASTVEAATKAGLLENLNQAEFPNMKDVPDTLKTATSSAIWLSPRGIFYRKDLVPFEIKTWQDLWDPRLKGKVGVSFALDRGNFLVLAALLNKGSEKNIDPGFAKIAEMKDNIHAIYKSDPESIKLLETGEIAVAAWGILPNVYRHLGPDSKYVFVMPAPRFLADIPVSIVKGRSPAQTAAAKKFVDFMLRPDSQTTMASIAGTIPANAKAEVPEKLKTVIPAIPVPEVYKMDWSTVNAQYSKWEERWMREVQVRR